MCFETKSSSSSSSSSKDKSSKSSSGGYNVTDTTTGKVTNYKSYDDAIAAANKIASDKGGSVEDRTTSSSSKDKSSSSSSSSKDKSSSETKTDYSGTNFNTAFKEARADLGPGQEFTYNGKKYSTATAEERPDLSGTTKTETETSTTSSGRGDPRDFGFVAEDAAASRPGQTTGTPLVTTTETSTTKTLTPQEIQLLVGGGYSAPATTTTPPEGRGTRIGDRTFVLTDDGLVLDAQTGAAASSDMATAVREKLNPSLTLDDIIGGQSQYDPTGGGVNPSYVEDIGPLPPMDAGYEPPTKGPDDGTRGTTTKTLTPQEIQLLVGGGYSVLPPVTNTAGIVGEAPFGTQLKPSYTQDQVETILSAAPYERTIYPSDGTGAFKFVVNRDTGELAPLVDPISGDLIATFGATPDPDYAQHFIDGYQGGLRGDALEEFVDERLGISPDSYRVGPITIPNPLATGGSSNPIILPRNTEFVQPINVEGVDVRNAVAQPVNIDEDAIGGSLGGAMDVSLMTVAEFEKLYGSWPGSSAGADSPTVVDDGTRGSSTTTSTSGSDTSGGILSVLPTVVDDGTRGSSTTSTVTNDGSVEVEVPSSAAPTLSGVAAALVNTHGYTNNGDGTVSSPTGRVFDSATNTFVPLPPVVTTPTVVDVQLDDGLGGGGGGGGGVDVELDDGLGGGGAEAAEAAEAEVLTWNSTTA
jgi:hypothetical protein